MDIEQRLTKLETAVAEMQGSNLKEQDVIVNVERALGAIFHLVGEKVADEILRLKAPL